MFIVKGDLIIGKLGDSSMHNGLMSNLEVSFACLDTWVTDFSKILWLNLSQWFICPSQIRYFWFGHASFYMSFIEFASRYVLKSVSYRMLLTWSMQVLCWLWEPYCNYTSHPIDKTQGINQSPRYLFNGLSISKLQVPSKSFNIPARPQILCSNWNLKWFPHWTLCMSNPKCHPYLHPIAFTEIKLARNVEWP